MDEMLRSVTRGWEIMTRAAGPFLLAGAVWTALNSLALWLLIGPALYGLFAMALKAHQGREVVLSDIFAAFDDVASPLVAGFVFFVPFALWGTLDGLVSGPPAALSAALVVHFGVFVHAFAVMADRSSDVTTCVRESLRIAGGSGPGAGGRVSDLARHLLFGGAVLLVVVVAAAFDLGTSFPFLLVFVGPLAACVLTAWYARRAYPTESAGGVPAAARTSESAAGGAPATKRPRKRRTP